VKQIIVSLLAVFTVVGARETSFLANRRGLATAASAVLPGSGQLLLGAKSRGEVQLWADLALWAGWTGFMWQSGTKEQDARLVAYAHAGATPKITSPQFFRLLEEYDNSAEYNEDVLREARRSYPDDPDAQRRYFESHAFLGDSAWDWESDSFRIKVYWPMRRAARDARLRAGFAAGALLLNRLIAVIDCAFILPAGHSTQRFQLAPRADGTGLEVRCRF